MNFIISLLIIVLVSAGEKQYLIDLNEPIRTRFSAPIFDSKDQVISLIENVESRAPWLFNMVVYLTRGFYYLSNPQLFEEHSAYAILLGIDHKWLMMLNFIIDMITNTTASIVKTPMEIILSHNLDLVELEQRFWNLTYMAYFHEYGVIRYQGIMFPGISGMFSGAWSVYSQFAIGLQLNQTTPFSSWNWIKMLFGYETPTMVVRKIMTNAKSIQDAITIV